MTSSAFANFSLTSSYVSVATFLTVAAADVVAGCAVCATEAGAALMGSGSTWVSWVSGSEVGNVLGWVDPSFGDEYAGGGTSGVASTYRR